MAYSRGDGVSKTLTEDELFTIRQNNCLENIPKEFHGALSSLAYQNGHAYGHDEVLSYLGDYCSALEPCFKEYERRLKQEH